MDRVQRLDFEIEFDDSRLCLQHSISDRKVALLDLTGQVPGNSDRRDFNLTGAFRTVVAVNLPIETQRTLGRLVEQLAVEFVYFRCPVSQRLKRGRNSRSLRGAIHIDAAVVGPATAEACGNHSSGVCAERQSVTNYIRIRICDSVGHPDDHAGLALDDLKLPEFVRDDLGLCPEGKQGQKDQETKNPAKDPSPQKSADQRAWNTLRSRTELRVTGEGLSCENGRVTSLKCSQWSPPNSLPESL